MRCPDMYTVYGAAKQRRPLRGVRICLFHRCLSLWRFLPRCMPEGWDGWIRTEAEAGKGAAAVACALCTHHDMST